MLMKKKHVLFLCTRNSARSQMAEGLLRDLAGERLEVFSAGLNPTRVHPMAVEVMQEIGIDIASQRSKSVASILARIRVDYAIFVCEKAEQNCPHVYPFSLRTLSWPFEDPVSDGSDDEVCRSRFRDVRNQIEARIRNWVEHESLD
jgi:arsenate reductase